MAFSELQKELKFITNHILTRELKLLQEEKLIVSEDKYALTPAGHELYAALEPLVTWSVKHAGKLPCADGKRCSSCVNYAETMGARQYTRIGKKTESMTLL